MKIHAIHHVDYEGLGFISDWISDNQLTLTETHAYLEPSFPDPGSFDGLIIMGGPMSVHDVAAYPWLLKEKELIRLAVEDNKKVLGICLGAQLIADCLGARVYRHYTPEIGWFPIKKTFLFHSWFTAFDDQEEATVLHWHNDTFELPAESMRLFKSNGTENQAFQVDDNVLGLQFHLEMTRQNLEEIISRNKHNLTPRQWVQNAEKILKCHDMHHEQNREMLYDLLSCFFLSEE